MKLPKGGGCRAGKNGAENSQIMVSRWVSSDMGKEEKSQLRRDVRTKTVWMHGVCWEKKARLAVPVQTRGG